MEIIINTSSSTPVFTQIIEQIKQGVADGKLKPEYQLPSIRQLANDLSINHNTVSKAFKLLERDGVIYSKGFRGTFIHPNAKKNCLKDLGSIVNEILLETVLKLKELGATDSEIRIAFNNVMSNRNN